MNWTQLKMVIWLRWRLTRNQVARHGKLNAVIAVIGTVFGILLALAAGVGGIVLGAMALNDVPPRAMMLIWDGAAGFFLFLWLIGILAEIQRSETIDLARLLHLPVSLEGIFVINYIASHVSIGLILFLPASLGVCIGLIFAKGPLMLLMLPLVLTFVFMVTAWTYCLRGWLVTLMVNPRRRRNVMVFITLAIVLIGQGPNLYFNVYLRHHGGNHFQSNSKNFLNNIPPGWLLAHDYVPVLWLPKGAASLAEGNVLPAVLGSLGAFLLGAAGLARAYRSTLRFYTGNERGKPTETTVEPQAATIADAKPIARKNFLEKRVPFVSEEVAAWSLAFLRSMTRAPEIRIALFTNIVVIIVLFGAMFSNSWKAQSPVFRLFSGTGAVAFTFFGLAQLIFNQFGYDRDGFRMFVLSPTRRRDILLAKNVALLPIISTIGLLSISLVAVWTRLPLLGVAAAIFKLATMFLLLSIAGNFASIWAPYRVTAGSLKPTKPPAKIIFLVMLTQLLFPLVMLPIAIPPLAGIAAESFNLWPGPLIDAVLSLVILTFAGLFYYLSLDGLGNFLEKREQKILLVVSQEVE